MSGIGMNARNGKALSGIEHLRQSINDILATPIGTRVMRRNYGSRLMFLLDSPVNEVMTAQIQAAVVEALSNYEPRLRLSRVVVNDIKDGRIDLTLDGFFIPNKSAIRLENITIA